MIPLTPKMLLQRLTSILLTLLLTLKILQLRITSTLLLILITLKISQLRITLKLLLVPLMLILLKKCHIGYIPNLERDVSETGFVVSASSISSNENPAYGAFNTLKSPWIANSSLGLTAWLTIKCPEPVIICRIALTSIQTLNSWCLSASNDGFLYIDLLRSNDRLVFNWDSVPKLLVLSSSSTTAYKYYKIDITSITGLTVGISYMQLYVYDT